MGSTLVTLVAYGAIEVAMAIAGVARPLCAALEIELVVAAIPTGPLAHAIDAYRQAVAVRVGENAAHRARPHCVLARSYCDRSSSLDLHQRALAATSPNPGSATTRPAANETSLSTNRTWHGLEIGSPALLDLGVEFRERLTALAGRDDFVREDPLRLVLAADFDAGDHWALSELAHRIVDPTLPVHWEVGLWQFRGDDCKVVWRAPTS